MKKLTTILLAAVAAISLSSLANATDLTFDDVAAASGSSLPAGYGGLNWSNLAIATQSAYRNVNITGMGTDAGYYTGVVSGRNTVFNSNGLPATISSANPFDFDGAFFTSAWSDLNSITATGYSNGEMTYSKTIRIDTKGPVWFDADFNAIDRLTLTTTKWQFAMDNFTFTFDDPCPSPIPEPSTWLLLGAGLGAIGFMSRKRKL